MKKLLVKTICLLGPHLLAPFACLAQSRSQRRFRRGTCTVIEIIPLEVQIRRDGIASDVVCGQSSYSFCRTGWRQCRNTFHQPESRIQFEHPWPRPMVTTDGHNSAFYLTNARELLDVAGEWYHDIDARKVYYYPREGEKLQDAGYGSDSACHRDIDTSKGVRRPVSHIRFEKIDVLSYDWMRPY